MRSLELLPGVVPAWLTVTFLRAAEHRGAVRFAGLPVPGSTVTASRGNTKLVATTDRQRVCQFPDLANGRLIDDLLSLFGGRTQPVMVHLVESGKLTMDDIEEARKALRKSAKKG